ncbi:MAG: hypothetical protein KC656_05070 [Myxococcales bacterium]|nr:hypothetical protein [Myxococcales bacterium]MCB9693710.1 hypothetical protein [Alphaproteobacteria bacterium]
MARFELHDGPLKKFWEIELQGETLHFTMGDIGSPGRTRSKRHRNERVAEEAYETAVRAMLAQGYEQQLDADEAEDLEGPTWSRLTEDPLDVEALGVHADWLMGREDPRGDVLAELLDLQRRGDTDGVDALHRTHRDLLLGDLAAFPGTCRVEWGVGHARTAVLQGSGTDAPNAAVEVLRHDGFALLDDLTIHMPAAVKVVFSGTFPAVRRLDLRSGIGEEGGKASDLDLDRLSVKAPRLRDLRVRGPNAVTGSDAVTGLLHLDISEAPGWLEAIVRARPALQTLHVSSTTPAGLLEIRQQGLLDTVTVLGISPAWDADLSDLLQVLEGLQLDRLFLRDVLLEEPHAHTLVRFQGVDGLTIDGALTPEAVEILQQRPFDGRWETEEVDDAEPVRPADLELLRLEKGSGKSGRFWSIGVDGKVHHVAYGTRGRSPKWIWTRFPSADVAAEIAERRIEEKLREGYLRPGDDAPRDGVA